MHRLDLRPGLGLALAPLLYTVGGTALAAPEGHTLLFKSAQAAARISEPDQRAIYAPLGLKVGADGQTLVFDGMDSCPALNPGSGDIQIEMADLNGDKKTEVFVSLGSTCMFGFAGTGVFLFTQDAPGRWQSHNLGAGAVVVQETHHMGYADVMVGGPGFCHPVQRWNGKTYEFHRKLAEQPGACDGQ
jgi:hypothetical protein